MANKVFTLTVGGTLVHFQAKPKAGGSATAYDGIAADLGLEEWTSGPKGFPINNNAFSGEVMKLVFVTKDATTKKTASHKLWVDPTKAATLLAGYSGEIYGSEIVEVRRPRRVRYE